MGENKNKFFIIESFAEFGIDKDIVTIGGKGVAPIGLCRVNQGNEQQPRTDRAAPA